MIKLDVCERTGRSSEKNYRLTEHSIENIARCLGIRTSEQASELFMESKQVEPSGECPTGHQEAAL